MKLSGNTILITGGTSGIGLAFAEKFLELDNRVIICGRRADRLQEIKDKYPAIITHRCDISEFAERKALHEWILAEHPATNILMNNAGIQLVTDLTKEVDLSRVEAELAINLVAPIHLSSLFASHLTKLNPAAIINISSGLAFTPIAFLAIYCASKAAIHSITLSLRYQHRKTGLRVIEIIPPSVDTELGHDRRSDKSQSHGGMPTAEFIEAALAGLEKDESEIAIGFANDFRAKREAAFESLNDRIGFTPKS